MRLKLATFTILVLTAVGVAHADSSSSPFSSQETQVMSGVWSKIREAKDFDDIDWHSVGLTRAPGDAEAHHLMADHWSKLRTAADFRDIDWRAIRGEDGSARNDFDGETGPFTRDEARDLSAAWPKIREADAFDDINWRSVGLAHAPGDRDARDFMSAHWESLKRAARFADIDWRAESRNN